jgi:hypothetical protein
MSLDARDERLRGSLIHWARIHGNRDGDGWVSGSKLAIVARDGERHPVDSDEHAERLLHDLCELQLLVEKQAQPTGGIGARELRHRRYKLTDKGWQLAMGTIDSIPGVDMGKDE